MSWSAGSIVGNPDDTARVDRSESRIRQKYVDWPYIQHPTPYPRTPMTKDFRDRGLIINERLEEYDGTTAVVKTEHLSADEVEFLRWQAERWMKLRHMPVAFAHSPLLCCGTRRRCSRTRSAEARYAHSSGLKTSARRSSASRPSGTPSAPTCKGRFLGPLGSPRRVQQRTARLVPQDRAS